MNEITGRDREILTIIMELSKAVRCCRQDDIFCEDVTFNQFAVLDAIARNRMLHMADLHGILSVDKSTTTRLIAPLVRQGLVTREKAGHDSRAAVLKLTEAGRETHEKIWDCLASFVRAVREELPEGKKDVALEGIGIFLKALQNVSSVRCSRDGIAAACRCTDLPGDVKEMPHG